MLLFSGINFPLCNNKSAVEEVNVLLHCLAPHDEQNVSYDQVKRHGVPQEESDCAQASKQTTMCRGNARCDSAGVLLSISRQGRWKKIHGSCSKQAVIVDYVMQLCKHAVASWRISAQKLISLIAPAVV